MCFRNRLNGVLVNSLPISDSASWQRGREPYGKGAIVCELLMIYLIGQNRRQLTPQRTLSVRLGGVVHSACESRMLDGDVGRVTRLIDGDKGRAEVEAVRVLDQAVQAFAVSSGGRIVCPAIAKPSKSRHQELSTQEAR